MKSVKRDGEWWVPDLPHDCGDIGPYGDKAEAEEHRVSLQRTFDHLDDWKFWTCEKPKAK